MANRPPAMVASRVELKSLRATITRMNTARMPTRAVLMRQPTVFSAPKTRRPRAIIHLPRGGWAT
jgi:hypothetical protein